MPSLSQQTLYCFFGNFHPIVHLAVCSQTIYTYNGFLRITNFRFDSTANLWLYLIIFRPHTSWYRSHCTVRSLSGNISDVNSDDAKVWRELLLPTSINTFNSGWTELGWVEPVFFRFPSPIVTNWRDNGHYSGSKSVRIYFGLFPNRVYRLKIYQ